VLGRECRLGRAVALGGSEEPGAGLALLPGVSVLGSTVRLLPAVQAEQQGDAGSPRQNNDGTIPFGDWPGAVDGGRAQGALTGRAGADVDRRVDREIPISSPAPTWKAVHARIS
jgi:hypothetical protein